MLIYFSNVISMESENRDSFLIYLPSNASMNKFPNNKPSDFRVELNRSLHLEGEWEVGVSSICYDSNIQNVNELEEMVLTPRTHDGITMNNAFKFPYNLTSDGKWNYEWNQLESDYYGSSDEDKIIKAFNSGNASIMKNKGQKVYEFTIYEWHGRHFYRFHSFTKGLTLRLDNEFYPHLGFGHSLHLTSMAIANVTKIYSNRINKFHYKFKIFDEDVVECKERIILKKRGVKPLTLIELVKRWNETVGKKYGEKVMARKDKLVIQKYNDKLAVYFSPTLRHFVRHVSPIIGSGLVYASHENRTKADSVNDEWWVDIYGDRIKKIYQSYQETKVSINTMPRLYNTVENFIRVINPYIQHKLKQVLKSRYDAKAHHISFSIKNQSAVLKLGDHIQCQLSNNLKKLSGFSLLQDKFATSYTIGVGIPMTLDKHEQHLYIQSDLISPISVGEKKEYILRNFIHDKDASYGIVEKMFKPIFYHPVIKQTIPSISLKITNGLHECIHVKDTKSLITLVFRKTK